MIARTALIGFGEAGSTFAIAGGWGGDGSGSGAHACDILPDRCALAQQHGLSACASLADAVHGVELVLSLVTADAAPAVAQEAAKAIAPGTLFCDMNSVAPQTKQESAAAVEAGGGRYVDVAILAPVNPARLSAPLLLSGAAADEAAGKLTALGFTNVRVVGEDIGRASAIKMVRSVMVKGIEALTDEMMAGAAKAGVTEEVLASLDASERDWGWRQRAEYNLERMETHGARRAAEMEEVAKTLAGYGVYPLMTTGTISRQRAAGERGAKQREGTAA